MNLLVDPWPWYFSGPLFALTMFALLFIGKKFGMSSNLRTACTIAGAGKNVAFFDFDWKKERWNLTVVLGVVLGGFIATSLLPETTVTINDEVATQLRTDYQISSNGDYMPAELFGADVFSNPYLLTLLLIGGILVGFGARYAGGCTSGHAISGLSNLQLPSLIAVIGFFIGGLLMIHLIFPLLF